MTCLNSFRLVLLVSVVLLATWYNHVGDDLFDTGKNATFKVAQYLQGQGPYSAASKSRRAAIPIVRQLATSCQQAQTLSLTFDDCPSEHMGTILTALRLFPDVHVTFFVSVYEGTQLWLDSLRKAVRDGHALGLRFSPTASKPPSSMSQQEFQQQLWRDSQAVFNASGKYPRFVRLPFGKFGERELQWAVAAGLVPVGWTLDPQEYAFPGTLTPKEYATRLKEYFTADVARLRSDASTTTNTAGGFVSIQSATQKAYADAEVTTQLVQHLRDSLGLQLVPLSQCLNIPGGAYRERNIDTTAATVTRSLVEYSPENTRDPHVSMEQPTGTTAQMSQSSNQAVSGTPSARMPMLVAFLVTMFLVVL